MVVRCYLPGRKSSVSSESNRYVTQPGGFAAASAVLKPERLKVDKARAFLVTADVPEIYMHEFWATATVHQHSIRFKMDTRKHIVDLEAFREMLHISGSASSTTPPTPIVTPTPTTTVVAALRLYAAAKGKQPARGDDEEAESDRESEEEETREHEEESFDTIPRTLEVGEDDGNGEKDQGLKISEEERMHKEEEADELYRDVDINQGRGLQVSQDIEDSHQMPEAVREAVQIQTDRLQDSIQRENDEFLRTIDDNMKKIIKEQVKTDLSEMELKKILIDKMEGNKSIQRSDEQRNLYKVLVEAYDADKTILDTYGESAILKRRHEEDDDQEGPSARSDRGSKRQRE
nr:hypothetical protein [Tanacetum cinerariifolium]